MQPLDVRDATWAMSAGGMWVVMTLRRISSNFSGRSNTSQNAQRLVTTRGNAVMKRPLVW